MHLTKFSFRSLIYNPIVQFILEPFFFILVGLTFALHYTPFHGAPTAILFLFLFLHQIIEKTMTQTPTINPVQFSQLHPFVEGLQILMLLYYLFNVSYLSFVLLLLYSFAIHIQFYSIQYFSKIIPITLMALIKSVVPNILIFYVHLRFIPIELFWIIFPLFLILILVQSKKWPKQSRMETQEETELILTVEQQENQNQKYFSLVTRRIIVAAIFISALIALWPLFSWFSLFSFVLVILARPIVRYSTMERLVELRLFFFGWVILISLFIILLL